MVAGFELAFGILPVVIDYDLRDELYTEEKLDGSSTLSQLEQDMPGSQRRRRRTWSTELECQCLWKEPACSRICRCR